MDATPGLWKQVVNHRLIPGESAEQVFERDRSLLRDALPPRDRSFCSLSYEAGTSTANATDPSLSSGLGFAIIAGRSSLQVDPHSR